MINFTRNEIVAEAYKAAAKSTSKKRRVGAVIPKGDTLLTGWNHVNNDFNAPCEDYDGNTLSTVVHAEKHVIERLLLTIDQKSNPNLSDYTLYVTYQPCERCLTLIKETKINLEIVTEFLKFDSGKLHYNLVPTSAVKALASVLTYGAKKYKPNNWKECTDTNRYIDALYRHLEAYRAGHVLDKESGRPHLAHALTNIAFLIHLEDYDGKDYLEA